jgi:hypothetical protein
VDFRVSDGDDIPGEDHVIRYCSFTRLREDGTPAATAFLPDLGDDYLSVFWLEDAGMVGGEAQTNDIRSRMTNSGIKLRSKAKLADLLVGRTKNEVAKAFERDLLIVHKPSIGESFVDDAHAGIFGFAAEDLAIATFIAENLIEALHPAKI